MSQGKIMQPVLRHLLCVSAVVGCLVLLGYRKEPLRQNGGCGTVNPKQQAVEQVSLPQKIETELLPNAFRLHERVISGGQPQGEEAFAELATLGVKTVISVDGATPEVESARSHGLRYVHLPHGYDGISERRAQELAKAVRDLPGPIYIHCHHGKHRSPAAAATACIAVGYLRPDQAHDALSMAGTSKNYRGLYQSAENAQRLDDALLDALEVEFKETVAIPPMAEAMVQLERTYEHLQQIADADWQAPNNHPDLDPSHEALLLREHFTELMRTDEVRAKDQQFRELLQASEAAAASLQAILLDEEARPAAAASQMAIISENCTKCHRTFRDVPLSDKW